jgi:putative salt-induced outer membrane protein YdiY
MAVAAPAVSMTLTKAAIVLVCLSIASTAVAQEPAKEPPPLWDVQVGASFVGTNGNSETATFGADFAGHRRGAVWQIESTATAVRSDDHDIRTAERYIGAFRGSRKLSRIVGVTTGIKAERDQFSGIDFRSIIDVGLTWALRRTPSWTLDGVTGIAWNHENRTNDTVVNDPVGLLQLLSRVPFPGGDTTQRFTFYPNFSTASAYREEAEVTAQASMNSWLALKIGYLWRFSHEPVPGFKTFDNTTTASVVLRWKASTPAPQ